MKGMLNKRTFYAVLCVALAGLFGFASCNNNATPSPSPEDTVSASVFAPIVNDTTLNIDLSAITSIRFPKYKVLKQQPIIPDSVSIALDEETVAGGNYSAILSFDTIPSQAFYERVEQAALQDTCWKVKEYAYTYKRKDKQGGLYRLAFSKGSMQIVFSHLNSDMIKNYSNEQ